MSLSRPSFFKRTKFNFTHSPTSCARVLPNKCYSAFGITIAGAIGLSLQNLHGYDVQRDFEKILKYAIIQHNSKHPANKIDLSTMRIRDQAFIAHGIAYHLICKLAGQDRVPKATYSTGSSNIVKDEYFFHLKPALFEKYLGANATIDMYREQSAVRHVVDQHLNLAIKQLLTTGSFVENVLDKVIQDWHEAEEASIASEAEATARVAQGLR